jgi:hypothetical protein
LNGTDALTPNPAYVYSRSLAALSFLRPAAEYNQLSLRERQDRLLRLSPHDLSYHVRDTITTRAIHASRRQRLSLARKLLDLGASLNQAHVATGDDLPVLSPSPARLKRLRTPLQLAAATGFTEMVKLLISRGADCGKVYPLDESRTLPILLAAKQALSPTGNHQTVEVFLKAGTSLESRSRSVLHHLHTLKPTPQSQDCHHYKQWLNLVELFLKHGAADQMSAEQFEEAFEEACSTPGNVQYCKMLSRFRRTDNFQKPALVNMMCKATRACWSRPRTAGLVQDTEMIRWVFEQCLDARHRLRFERDVLDMLLREAYGRNMFKVVQLLRELLAELKKAGN